MDGLGASIRRIGRLAAGKGVVALRGGEPFAAPRRRGFEHFTR
jgi:hypothetical protein